MPNPTAAMLVIGDEILSGRTRDANMYHLAHRLTEHGVDLCEARIVRDQPEAIVAALDALRAAYDHVFTSGGIGPTHDDITADCVARAFGVGIGVRADARATLAAHYPNGEADLTEARLRMARVPDGAELIENPVSRAPGFTLGNVHVMAGVPEVFRAMVDSVLPRVTGGTPLSSESVRMQKGEGEIAAALSEIQARFPQVQIGSYPFQRDGLFQVNVVLRATDRAALDAATNDVRALTG